MTHADQKHYDADEPVRGLPARLPKGEGLLWQGSPRWFDLARRCFHLQGIAIYFAVMLSWNVVSALYDGQTALDVARSLVVFAGVSAFVMVVVAVLSWAIARTTVYSITTRRVVIRAGVAMPKTVNLPFARLDRADVKLTASGAGDIVLTPLPEDRIAYLVLWPHLKAFQLSHVRPMLRSIPDAAGVAQILGTAMEAELARLDVALTTGPALIDPAQPIGSNNPPRSPVRPARAGQAPAAA